MDKVQKMRQRLAEILDEAKKMQAAVEAGEVELGEESTNQIDALHAEAEKIATDIDQTLKVEEIEGMQAASARDSRFDSSPPEVDPSPFGSLGEQLLAIRNHYEPGKQADPRLYVGASTDVGTQSGFAIGPTFVNRLMERSFNTGVLLNRCDVIPIGANSNRLSVPMIDHDSRATGSRWGGVQVYWRKEAETVTATRPALKNFELSLLELMGLARATEEELEDATQLEAVFERAFAEEFGWKLDEAIFRGDGAGEPLGILNSGAYISVAKESGQAADTIVAANVVKMLSRMWRPGRAEFFCNMECFDQLPLMTIGDRPVFLPPAGLTSAPLGTLFGRPINPLEQASKLGDLGDFNFLNLDEYAVIRKGALRAAQSMHLYFDTNERAFRWTMRINGAPKWEEEMTPAYANTGFRISPFVGIAARA